MNETNGTPTIRGSGSATPNMSMVSSNSRLRRVKRRESIARNLARTPSPDAFSFRPHADEDNAPTEREIIIKNMAADQLCSNHNSEDE